MRFCFKTLPCLTVAAVFALAPGLLPAASSDGGGQRSRIRSIVRADARTGRLIRTVAITHKAAPAIPDSSVSEIVEEVAKKHDVDPLLVHSMIQVESAYNPFAVSPKGAQGLMQLMPATARRFGVTNTFDVRDNIEGGVRYLKYLDTLFPNDLRLKLAAYNAGEGAVWKYNNTVPPYAETREYVQKVGTRFGDALKKAEKKKPASDPDAPAVANSDVYAPVVSYVDSEGRLFLRTAQRSTAKGTDTVSMP